MNTNPEYIRFVRHGDSQIGNVSQRRAYVEGVLSACRDCGTPCGADQAHICQPPHTTFTRPLVTIHLPVDVTVFTALLAAVAHEHPDATITSASSSLTIYATTP